MRAGEATGNYAEAIKTLEYLKSDVDPSYTFGRYNLALTYWKAGRRDDAFKEAQVVLGLDPTFCKTFKDDPNYGWFAGTPEYHAACK